MVKAFAKPVEANGADGENDGSDKLHELYWNRAQLKQQFAAKEQENQRLLKLIGEQEGATARVRQQLEHLENLLVDPDWVHNVVVFYQLRGLNERCCRKLAAFAERLKQQREDRLRKQGLVTWNEKRKKAAAAAGHTLSGVLEQRGVLEGQLADEQHSRESMRGLGRLFKGRQSTGVLEDIETKLGVLRQREGELREELESIRRREPPSPPGLDLATKRSINVMILSFAQDLLLRFSDRNFAAMVRESGEKSVGAINYGSRADCERLLTQIGEELERVEAKANTPDVLRQRAARIAEHADFASDGDAVPVAGTVAAVFAFDASGVVTTTDGNILGQDYWGISRVVSR